MQSQEEQVNRIAIYLGGILIDSGIKFAQSGFKAKVKPIIVSFGTVKDYFINAGLGDVPLVQMDMNYFLTTWNIWGLMIDYTLLDKLLWIADKFDCDNRAFLFSSLAAILTGVNSCGTAYGKVYNDATKDFIAYHYFNVIATSDGKLYCYEPHNDGSCLIEKGKPIVIGGWEYRITSTMFF